ncbi:MAG: hypothetical protein PVJ53_07950 [Desulfobacterales bacterium]|jgi:hypothetical protein
MEISAHATPETPTPFSFDQTMKMRMNAKPNRCPWCASTRIAILLNGMPVYIPELQKALDTGGAAIGRSNPGCEEPAWQCTDCCAHFFRAFV